MSNRIKEKGKLSYSVFSATKQRVSKKKNTAISQIHQNENYYKNNKKKHQKKCLFVINLAKSVSKSRTGNSGTDDNHVSSGLCNLQLLPEYMDVPRNLHKPIVGLNHLHQRSSVMNLLLLCSKTKQDEEPQQGSYDNATQKILINHLR